jgi:hypothetical protein
MTAALVYLWVWYVQIPSGQWVTLPDMPMSVADCRDLRAEAERILAHRRSRKIMVCSAVRPAPLGE